MKRLRIAYLSTYPPRECGIATFTKDLVSALNRTSLPISNHIIAINEKGETYNYDESVRFQIQKEDLSSYQKAAEYVNKSKIDLVNLEHEFGLFGGEKGDYILKFIRNLKKPLITTLHTIVPSPSPRIKKVIKEIGERSALILSMAKTGTTILENDYGLGREKIRFLPHGVPQIDFIPPEEMKERLGFKSRFLISSFGLLDPRKGMEYVIKALPPLVKEYPSLLYLIIGETHPELRKRKGERYRKSLLSLVEKEGLSNNVKFHNRYLRKQELIRYLQAADVYITPYLDENQIVSGTLSYAMGCGKAIISTPYLYAKEVLSKKRGLLCPFRDSQSIYLSLKRLIEDKELRESLQRKSYEYSRSMTWPAVVRRIAKLDYYLTSPEKIKLDHLFTLTDEHGILQHTKYSIPNRKEGYTTDDNSRALLFALRYYHKYRDERMLDLAKNYLGFLHYVQKGNGKFHNFLDYGQGFLDEEGSEESWGRTIWAVGYAASLNMGGISQLSKEIFEKGSVQSKNLSSFRARAFFIFGLYQYPQATEKKKELMVSLLSPLLQSYEESPEQKHQRRGYSGDKDWKWFEPELTYGNAHLPLAFFLAYDITKEKRFLNIGKESFDFLIQITTKEGFFLPIGNKGWFKNGKKRAIYDQQPIEAFSMIETACNAYRITGDEKYKKVALDAFAWFSGKNSEGILVYDPLTGGCCDGLKEGELNLNEGTESTLSYLLSALQIENLIKTVKLSNC